MARKMLSITVDTVGIKHCQNIGVASLATDARPVLHLLRL